ncbi:inner nuclear membrane protein Man1-like protein, partial [Leptotrombidium deliense]
FASFGKGDPLQLELDVNSGSRGTHAPICEEKITSTTSKCFHSSNNVTAALFIVKSIQNFIQEYSYQYLCESNGGKVTKEDPFSFSLPELRTHVLLQKEKFCKFTDVCGDDEHSDEVVLKSLGYALDLIKLNPQWNIIVDEESDKDYFLRIDPDTYQLSLPFYCRMQLYLTKTMKHLILSMIVIAVVWAVFTYVHRKRKQAAEIQEQIIDLVEKSLDLLQSPDNPQSMPVIHIRDMLFTTQERQSAKCMKIWSKVVSFIEENESRVKVGIEKIDGEDYKTWKWIATSKGNTSLDEGKSTTMKTGTIEWQGQAFCDERPSEGQNNTHVVVNENAMLNSTKKATPNSQQSNTFFAPTCFLKVRNMFTAETQMDPNWKVNIENAILEKCSANSLSGKHGVLHICVEDQDSEGIVYIKCDSRDSATVAFHALHGWWCERKLVSVKFLKEERYYSRFPEARCFNEPLQIRNIYR